jgi:hypothetical protein
VSHGFQGEDDAAVRGVRGADGDGEEFVSVDLAAAAFDGVAGVRGYAVTAKLSGFFVGGFVLGVVRGWAGDGGVTVEDLFACRVDPAASGCYGQHSLGDGLTDPFVPADVTDFFD